MQEINNAFHILSLILRNRSSRIDEMICLLPFDFSHDKNSHIHDPWPLISQKSANDNNVVGNIIIPLCFNSSW